MTQQDYIYLNVPGLLNRYTNPAESWENDILLLTGAIIGFLKGNDLIVEGSSAWRTDLKDTVLRYSDLSPLGQKFLDSGAIEKWTAGIDREKNKNPSAKPSIEKLQKRFDKFFDAEQ